MTVLSFTFPGAGWYTSTIEATGWDVSTYLTTLLGDDSIHAESDFVDQEHSEFVMEYTFPSPVHITEVEWTSVITNSSPAPTFSGSGRTVASYIDRMTLITSNNSDFLEGMNRISVLSESGLFDIDFCVEMSAGGGVFGNITLDSGSGADRKRMVRTVVNLFGTDFVYWDLQYWNGSSWVSRAGAPWLYAPLSLVPAYQKVRWSAALSMSHYVNGSMDATLESVHITYTPSWTYHTPNISGSTGAQATKFLGRKK